MQPLTSIHVRTEALLLSKVEVWWYLLVKLGPNLSSNFEQVDPSCVLHLLLDPRTIKECQHSKRNRCIEERRHLGVGPNQEYSCMMMMMVISKDVDEECLSLLRWPFLSSRAPSDRIPRPSQGRPPEASIRTAPSHLVHLLLFSRSLECTTFILHLIGSNRQTN